MTTDKQLEQLRQNNQAYKRKADEIREDWTLSERAKRVELERAYTEARGLYEEHVAQRREDVAARVEKTRREAFKAPAVLGADKANLMTSYRDALYRLDGVTDASKLSAMLERAHETGDIVMSKALLRRGYELRSEQLVGSYLENFPQERERWDAFTAAAEESNRLETFGDSLALGVAAPERPPELDHPDIVAEGAA